MSARRDAYDAALDRAVVHTKEWLESLPDRAVPPRMSAEAADPTAVAHLPRMLAEEADMLAAAVRPMHLRALIGNGTR